ncbi:MAG: hypothetical protein JXX28_19625 [Deltaproteobacteria bacterium]|nr:hypothetical protein [Deltaproteobacteria bacterium]
MSRYLAIDLGTCAVKVSAYQSAGRGAPTLELREAERVPQDGVTPVTLAEQLAALDQILARHPDWRSGSAAGLAWPSSRASSHPMRLPFTDKAQIAKTLPFAVEGLVPFDVDDMILAWRTLAVVEDTALLVSFAPHAEVAEAIAALQGRGLNPRVVHLSGELLGALALPTGAEAVVDIGHTSTTASLVVDGVVRLVRTVSVGGRDLTLAVQRATHTTFSQSTARKEADSRGELRSVYGPALALLVAELRATLVALEDAAGVELSAVRLAGDGGRLEGFAALLSGQLGISVAPPDGEGGFAVADALAERLAGQGGGELTCLRRGALAYRGSIDLFRVVSTYGVALIAFFLVASVAGWAWRSHTLSVEIEASRAAVLAVVTDNFPEVPESSLQSTAQIKSVMKERTDDAVERAKVLGAEKDTPPTVSLLRGLTKAFPPPEEVTVDVSELTIAPGAITLDAETSGFGDVATIEESVRGDARFAAATSKDPKKVRDKIRFVLNIPLEGKE